MNFEKINYFANLLDFYHPLLTEKQRVIAKLFFYDNLGLTEIAQEQHSTKQAISDLLNRTENLLSSYEQRLKIYEKYSQSLSLFEDGEIKENFIKIWE